MPIPPFQDLFRPFLEYTSDGQIRSTQDVAARLADRFAPTTEEIAELLPSGRQARFHNRHGLDAVYIQAKRWEGSVGSPVVRDFVGSLVGHAANKGVLITTSHFTEEALDYAQRIPQKVVLIDGPMLAGLMIDFGIGVSDVATYPLKRRDADYFGQE